MNLNEKSLMFGICSWLSKQPEYTNIAVTEKESIFYNVAPAKFAELILRFVAEEIANKENGKITIFDAIGIDNLSMFENMQYYMEYCAANGYVTPKYWLENEKHF